METIKENNKLIAKFMGGVLSSAPNLINLPQTRGDANIYSVKGSETLPNGTYSLHRLSELKYHTSWDWLIPVVEKIHKLGGDYDFFSTINLKDTYQSVTKFIETTK